MTQDRNMWYVSKIEEYRNLFFLTIIKKWEIIMKGKIIYVKIKRGKTLVILFITISVFFSMLEIIFNIK